MNGKAENIRTIKTVLNLDTGKIIFANKFLELEDHIVFPFREKCQDAYKKKREPILVCEVCGQMVQISGGKGLKGKIKYFKHFKDSKDCPIKTDTKLSQKDILRGKFNGQPEGTLHIETKLQIYNFLCLNKASEGDVSFAQQEMVNKSERDYLRWKKPDVTSIFKGKKLVFEIQLSTTFLDVIYDRQHFYKDSQTFIIWVFRNFEIEADKQKFTQKDIFYSNNRNAFILDEQAIELSRNNNDLYLLCQFQVPKADGDEIKYNWESKYVTLKDLMFDNSSYKVYYFDVDNEEEKVKTEIVNRIQDRKEREKVSLIAYDDLEKEQFEIDNQEERFRMAQYEAEIKIQKYKFDRQQEIKNEHKRFIIKNFSFFKRLDNYGTLTPLQAVFKANFHQIGAEIDMLFKKGYEPSAADLKFLKKEYLLEKSDYKHSDRKSVLYFLSLTTFYWKLKNHPEYLAILPKIERVLIAILSIKEKIVIGYSFNQLIQIPHQFIGNTARQEFTLPIIEAIHQYYGFENFIREQDRKKTLEKKIESLNGKIPNLNDEYKKIISMVFKDLVL